MRGPILPLYAAAHGATATGVGFIVAAHMAVAAAGSIPLGRASDVWGRRPLLLGGMLVSAVTSLLLPLFEREVALMTVYGLAGLGVAAFTPSALSLVTDGAAPGRLRLRLVHDGPLRGHRGRPVPRRSRGRVVGAS
jgi:MFS family permease